MSSLISEVLSQVYSAVSQGEKAIDWSFNDTQIEGRGSDIFYILSCDEINLSNEVYHASTVRRRFMTMKIKCTAFAASDTAPLDIADSFQSQICDKLFESQLEISEVSCTDLSLNIDYDRLEMCAYITARFVYVY